MTRLHVNMDRAREICRERLRREREPLLAALDVEFLRATEDRNPARRAAILARKRALRDATKNPQIDAATCCDDLRAVTLPPDPDAEATP